MDRSDEEIVAAVRQGDVDAFEEIVQRYSPRLLAMARRHSRREDEVADLVQEAFIKAFQKLDSFRGDAPFEHWLMRLAVRICYDGLRRRQRDREFHFSDLSPEEAKWLEVSAADPGASATASQDVQAAKTLVERILEQLRPAHRLVLTLLELEDRPVKEIAGLTGWSETLVKVRAFRARAEMKKILQRISQEKYL